MSTYSLQFSAHMRHGLTISNTISGGMPADGFFADEEDEESKRVTLSDEQKMICSPWAQRSLLVRGYALKEKIWLNFFV